mmetsp:Transcript_2118/g.3156  ORF Transcript_2118/g.3156 Transcript_2118/m.3156 type:complete len:115 (+) Transcript_2118:358-702(+)
MRHADANRIFVRVQKNVNVPAMAITKSESEFIEENMSVASSPKREATRKRLAAKQLIQGTAQPQAQRQCSNRIAFASFTTSSLPSFCQSSSPERKKQQMQTTPAVIAKVIHPIL